MTCAATTTLMSTGRPGMIRDAVTPHKIVVLVYAREVCRMKSAVREQRSVRGAGTTAIVITENAGCDDANPVSEPMTTSPSRATGAEATMPNSSSSLPPTTPLPFVDGHQRREFATTMLELIQGSDLDLRTLLSKIEATSSEALYDAVLLRIREMATAGISGLMDFIQSLETLLVDPNHPIPAVHKSSVIGLFVRRMMLVFDKLSFGQTTALHAAYRHYCRRLVDDGESSKEETDSDVDVAWPPTASRRQAELFVARQMALLLTNEGAAVGPSSLQNRLKQLLAVNPNLPEAHFLSMMNCLRVKEYVGAVNALHRAFDCSSTVEQQHDKSKNSAMAAAAAQSELDTPQNFRFAALNLGSLLCSFGYRKQALLALKEAMRMAREANDNVCLQHALSWLYRLENDRKEALVERSITKAGELSLPYLASLGILTFSQMKSSTAAKPALIFEFLRKCDILNCQHSILELMTQSYSQKANLWNLYGKKQMMSLAIQLLLYLNTSEMACHSSHHCGEALCRALSRLALLFSDEGNYDRADEILLLARETFPSRSPHSVIWMYFEQVIRFDRALKHCDWRDASTAVANLITLSVDESQIREAEILMYRGEISKARRLLNKLSGDEGPVKDTEFRVRTLILLGLCHCHANNSPMAVMLLCSAFTLAQQFHLCYLQAVASLHLAFAQYLMGYPSKAIDLMDASKVHFLSNGSLFDRARALLLHAKCRVAQTKITSSTIKNSRSVLQEAAVEMGRAANHFLHTEAYHWAKDAFNRQAMLCDELDYVEERNKAAFQFRKLDQQSATMSPSLSEIL